MHGRNKRMPRRSEDYKRMSRHLWRQGVPSRRSRKHALMTHKQIAVREINDTRQSAGAAQK